MSPSGQQIGILQTQPEFGLRAAHVDRPNPCGINILSIPSSHSLLVRCVLTAVTSRVCYLSEALSNLNQEITTWVDDKTEGNDILEGQLNIATSPEDLPEYFVDT